MGPGFGFGPPPNHEMNEKLKEPRPQNLREVPGYLKRTVGKTLSRLFYIFKLVWEAKPSLLLMMMFMTIFNGLLPVISAYISASLLNGISKALGLTGNGQTASLSLILTPLLMLLVFQLIRSLVSNINTIITRISGEYVTNHIKLKIMNKARELDLSSFDMPDFYERLENANREAGMRPIHVLNSFFSIFSTLISIVSFIAVLWSINWWAPLAVILVSIPSAVINFHFRKKNFAYMRRRSKDRRQMTYYSDLLVNKDMVKEVKLFGLSGTFVAKYKEVFHRYFAGLKKLITREGAWNMASSLMTTGVNFLLLLYFAYRVCQGDITEIGQYSIYTGALDTIALGVASLISTTATIYEGVLFIDNMILFMEEKKNIVSTLPDPPAIKRHTGHRIEFKHVSFAYPGTRRPVLKDINVVIEPGDTVVLVGLNGAGKTTFLKLLTRLYDPTEGVIELDGRDIREYDPDELYRIFGIIFQDFGKYAFSVSDNIVFGDIHRVRDEERIRQSAQASGADEFIRTLPQGYDTSMMRYFEPTGIEPSIGQWQKLSIARAFYADSDIMILDEPTASLDPMAEQEVFSQFDRLRGDKTTIFVSHRLSSATVASRILVMKNGEIIENGTHTELMAKGGEYYTLFSTQAKRYLSHDSPPPVEEQPVSPAESRHRPPFGVVPDSPHTATPSFRPPFGMPPHPEEKEEQSDTKGEDTFRVPFGVVPERDEPPVDTPPKKPGGEEFRMPFGVMPEDR